MLSHPLHVSVQRMTPSFSQLETCKTVRTASVTLIESFVGGEGGAAEQNGKVTHTQNKYI